MASECPILLLTDPISSGSFLSLQNTSVIPAVSALSPACNALQVKTQRDLRIVQLVILPTHVPPLNRARDATLSEAFSTQRFPLAVLCMDSKGSGKTVQPLLFQNMHTLEKVL